MTKPAQPLSFGGLEVFLFISLCLFSLAEADCQDGYGNSDCSNNSLSSGARAGIFFAIFTPFVILSLFIRWYFFSRIQKSKHRCNPEEKQESQENSGRVAQHFQQQRPAKDEEEGAGGFYIPKETAQSSVAEYYAPQSSPAPAANPPSRQEPQHQTTTEMRGALSSQQSSSITSPQTTRYPKKYDENQGGGPIQQEERTSGWRRALRLG